MRVNVGIRRRLAPLLGNDRRKIELLNGLLFSLPGTPVIYYGDELGMGDNVYLGDRDSVRTPMQWSPDRNAGFSDANPQRLYLPTIIDPEYNFETVNVEAQQRNPDSLLSWMRRLIALRQRHKVFGRGDIEFLFPENAKVLVFIRSTEHERVLVVANLSRFAQSVHLDLPDYRGAVLWELFGGTEFGVVGESGYHLTLGPYGFYWFAIVAQSADRPGTVETGSDLPVVRVASDWHSLFQRRGRGVLHDVLPQFFDRSRWFAGKARVVREIELHDAVPVPVGTGREQCVVALVHVDYLEGEPETYVLPVLSASDSRIDEVLGDHPQAGICWVDVDDSGERQLLYDASVDESFAHAALAACRRRRSFEAGGGASIRAWGTAELRRMLPPGDVGADLPVVVPTADQSNTSVMFGSRIVMKLFRRAQEGVNPDLEIGRYLTEQARFEHAAPLLGAVEHQRGRGEARTLAVLYGYVPNEGDAWHYTLDAISLYYESVPPAADGTDLEVAPWAEVVTPTTDGPPPPTADAIGPYLDTAVQLGRRTAELHAALAAGTGDAFVPEPFTTLTQRSLYQSLRAPVRRTLQMVRRSLPRLGEAARADAERVLDSEAVLQRVYSNVRDARLDAYRTRIHGDYHLGQVLHAGRDFVIIDFEGEPSRSPTERRIKKSPLVDVAGMLRSFQYAERVGLDNLAERGLVSDDERAEYEHRGRVWSSWVSSRFVAGYFDRLDELPESNVLRADPEHRRVLLDAFVLDKALYEIRYELNHRPHWASIPIDGIHRVIEAAS
jgi:maltose alpha-D-glucosyltransferase/alpha-amylase